MNPTADYPSASAERQLDGGSSTTLGSNEKLKDTVEGRGPLRTIQPYDKIEIGKSAMWLFLIIFANCFTSTLLCICVWRFSKFDHLTVWQKRSFNTSSQLLSSALGFGIAFLFTQVGLLARWNVFKGCRPGHGKEVEVQARSIMRGTLSQYALLFKRQVFTLQQCDSTALLLFLFLLCSLLGRFGVAFLGFAYNIDVDPYSDAPLFRPDWENGSLNRDDSSLKALTSALGISKKQADAEQTGFANLDHIGALLQTAQGVMGLPWLVPRVKDDLPYLNNTNATSYAMNVSHFLDGNLTMQALGDNSTLFGYKFQNFHGETEVPAELEVPVSWVTRCEEFRSTQDTAVPLITANFTNPAYELHTGYRWIIQLKDQLDESGYYNHNATTHIWLVGRSPNYTDLPNLAPLVAAQSYLDNSTVIFNCSLSFNSGAIGPRVQTSLRLSVALPFWGYNETSSEYFRNFLSTLEFDFGVSRQDRNASALWLSAYIGNYMGNCLSYLNRALGRVKIKEGSSGSKTKLEVKWERVAGTLGGLAGLQIVFGLAALLYCRKGHKVVENVSDLLASVERG